MKYPSPASHFQKTQDASVYEPKKKKIKVKDLDGGGTRDGVGPEVMFAKRYILAMVQLLQRSP